MKRNILLCILAITMLLSLIPLQVSAVFVDYETYTPYDLSVKEIPEEDTHPTGSALLTFKINDLPGATGDNTLTWYVGVEKKVGNGQWKETNLITTETMLSEYQISSGVFSLEQIWVEDYNWEGVEKISYRVYVLLDDLVGNNGWKSDYSNEAALGLVSSKWAEPELKKADEYGLIPDILKGADMTKPITREEFAELAVKLYEKVTGKAAVQASPNPFKDTSNPQILKAFKLGTTLGTSATTFSPDELINREQCAAMLFRTMHAIKPDGDFKASGVKDFTDQKHISKWAVDAAKYMSGKGIIKGNTNGEFMPKATTTVQKAQGYGMATREAAVLMTVRAYEGMK